jgi:hypothetical protein
MTWRIRCASRSAISIPSRPLVIKRPEMPISCALRTVTASPTTTSTPSATAWASTLPTLVLSFSVTDAISRFIA